MTPDATKIVTLAKACDLLLDEKVVAVPTETVYGLAALATSESAINRVFQIKKRPAENPLICHFHDFEQTHAFLYTYPRYVTALQRSFGPGPVSYLLPLNEHSPLRHAVRGQNNVIVRIPSHPVFLELLRCVNAPLAAPSANTSGKYSATTAAMVVNDIGNEVDGILDGGSSESGIESTILDCTRTDRIAILRPGAIGKADVERVLQNHDLNVTVEYSKASQPTPGASHKHYAPLTHVERIESLTQVPDDRTRKCVLLDDNALVEARLFFKRYEDVPELLSLGPSDQPQVIAHNLYASMAKLDALDVQRAYVMYPTIGNDDWRLALFYRLDKIIEPR